MIIVRPPAPFISCDSCGQPASIYIAIVRNGAHGPKAETWLCETCKANLRGALTTSLEAQTRAGGA